MLPQIPEGADEPATPTAAPAAVPTVVPAALAPSAAAAGAPAAAILHGRLGAAATAVVGGDEPMEMLMQQAIASEEQSDASRGVGGGNEGSTALRLPPSKYHIPVITIPPPAAAAAPAAASAASAASAAPSSGETPARRGAMLGRHRVSWGGDDEPRAAAARAAAARAAASRASLAQGLASPHAALPGVALALRQQQAYHQAAATAVASSSALVETLVKAAPGAAAEDDDDDDDELIAVMDDANPALLTPRRRVSRSGSEFQVKKEEQGEEPRWDAPAVAESPPTAPHVRALASPLTLPRSGAAFSLSASPARATLTAPPMSADRRRGANPAHRREQQQEAVAQCVAALHQEAQRRMEADGAFAEREGEGEGEGEEKEKAISTIADNFETVDVSDIETTAIEPSATVAPKAKAGRPDAASQETESERRLTRELIATKHALYRATKREEASISQAQRLAEQNDVLLALLGQPNSGRPARAAQKLQFWYRRILQGRAAAVPLQAAARRRLCKRRYAAARRAAVCMQRASRGLLARRAYGSCRAAAIRISALQRARVLRAEFVAVRLVAVRLQAAARRFLCRLAACPSRATLRLEALQLRQQLGEMRRALDAKDKAEGAAQGERTADAVTPTPGSPPQQPSAGTAAPLPIVLSPATPATKGEQKEEQEQRLPPPSAGPAAKPAYPADLATAVATAPTSTAGPRRVASRAVTLAAQLEMGFRHAMRAVTVFEVPNFLSSDELVVESHIFCDQNGFAWRIWVKPHDKNGCIGLYLVPAEDLDEPHTADFELAIVGPKGKLWRRELRGGRALLHKRSAGHGWPTFVSREEAERGLGEADVPLDAMLHKGTLVVTASRISNVRPKGEEAEGVAARSELSRTI